MIDDDHLDEFNEKYKLRSARNPDWNYSSEGIYYLTICCWKHNKHFGRIDDGKMILSKMGIVTDKCLIEIPKHFKNVSIDEYIIMPNHVHILIRIDNGPQTVETPYMASLQQSNNANDIQVETCHGASLQKNARNIFFQNIAEKGNQTIPKIINQFKSAVTRYANQNNILFAWQSRYYDEIVKSEEHYWRVKSYIKNNLESWETDII